MTARYTLLSEGENKKQLNFRIGRAHHRSGCLTPSTSRQDHHASQQCVVPEECRRVGMGSEDYTDDETDDEETATMRIKWMMIGYRSSQLTEIVAYPPMMKTIYLSKEIASLLYCADQLQR